MKYRQLLDIALAAREHAYAPYSGFRVGAALLSTDGRVFCGSNMENASYSATICAERAAFSTAISAGAREFTAIAIAGGKGNEADLHVAPCGVCRQVMAEFCPNGALTVVLGNEQEFKTYPLAELLPMGFNAKNLEG